jgi:hypothetical protein
MITWWKNNEGNRSLDQMFGNVSGSVSAYAKFFFDDKNDKRRDITTWGALQKEDISKKKESEEE